MLRNGNKKYELKLYWDDIVKYIFKGKNLRSQ